MKFLSKLAQYFAKGLQVLGVFQPIVQQVVGNGGAAQLVQTVSQDITQIANAVIDAEQVGVALQLKGSEKLKAAAPKVADIILRSTILVNHSIANADLFNQGVNEVAGGFADILNSLHADGIQAQNKQA